MEWSIFALVQMFIITIGVSLAFWLRYRTVQKQNEQLRSALEAEPDTPVQSPETWLREHIATLPADSPATAVLTTALEHTLEPKGDIESLLKDAISASGWELDTSNTERLAELEAELAAAKAAVDALPEDGSGDNDRTEELKLLLQQFTKDSREMMACIQTLETENAQLRAQLGLGENDPIPSAETAQQEENAA